MNGEKMVDYKVMYMKLFNAVTDAITVLQNVQSEVDEMYISYEEMGQTFPKDTPPTPEEFIATIVEIAKSKE